MTGAEMLKRVLPRMAKVPQGAGVSFVDALNTAVGIFFERLHRMRSEIARAQFSAVSVTGEITALPADFRGLATNELSLLDAAGVRTKLVEMPFGADQDITGDPVYFKMAGALSLQILPAPAVTYTLDGWYYSHPAALTLASTIPWSGLFDAVLADAVVVISGAGSVGAVIGSMRESIGEMVDGVIASRTITPRRNKLCL